MSEYYQYIPMSKSLPELSAIRGRIAKHYRRIRLHSPSLARLEWSIVKKMTNDMNNAILKELIGPQA